MSSAVFPSDHLTGLNEETHNLEKYVQYALGFIDIDTKIRRDIIGVTSPGSPFNKGILICILLNAIAIACTDYRYIDENYNPRSEDSTTNFLIEKAEIFFFVIFTLEFILKIIAFGFVKGKNTYLRDHWNKMDFIVLVLSAFGLTPLLSNMSVIRTIRVLRPLRSLSRLPGLKKIIGALMDSIEDLWNVMLLLTFFLFCFSTAGVVFWSGKLDARCRLTPFPVKVPGSCRSDHDPCWQHFMDSVVLDPNSHRCLPVANTNRSWTKSTSPWNIYGPQDCIWPVDKDDERICSLSGYGFHTCIDKKNEQSYFPRICGSNFDNVGNPRFLNADEPYGFPRMESGVFIESLNWGYTRFDTFFNAFITSFQIISMEGWTDIMYQVMDAWHIAPTIIIFVTFILVGGHIVLNLVLAVITGSLDNLDHDGKNVASKKETANKMQTNENSSWKDNIIKNRMFENFMMICIIGNTIILGMDRFMLPKQTETILETINLILNGIFFIEMILYIYAFGFKDYCRNPVLVFDGSIVIISMLEMGISGLHANSNGGQSAFSVFRALRIFRIFKLAKSWKSLNRLLRTMYNTILEIGNFAILLLIFIFIYALIGMQIFANRMHFHPDSGNVIRYGEPGYDEAEIPRSNFDTFAQAMTTVFQVLSGENWNSIMYDGRRATSSMSVAYFISLVVLGVFIVMSLFLAILLKNFESEGREGNNIIFASNDDEEELDSNSYAKRIRAFFDKIHAKIPKYHIHIPYWHSLTESLQTRSRNVVDHAKFDSVMTFFIVASSICLALDNPLDDPETWKVKTLHILNIVFTIIFTIEMATKTFAYGFVFNKGSYLKNPWNVLDFLAVIVSVLDLVNLGPGQFLRAFRTLRILRPLRMISRFPELKVVVDTLLSSLPAVLNVAICCVLFFFIFAIFGVNFLKGTFYHCNGDNFDSLSEIQRTLITYPKAWGLIIQEKILKQVEYATCDVARWESQYTPSSKELCNCLTPGGWTEVIPQNFNNVFSAMALLFEISSTEGWVDVMFTAVDQRGIDMQPVKNSNMIWILFFVLFLLVGAFFILEMFVGVVIDNFNHMRQETGRVLMTEAQKEWASTQNFIMKIKPERRMRRPTGTIRKRCYDFVMPGSNPYFEKIIIMCILIGSICTAASGFEDSQLKRDLLEYVSVIITLIFTFESMIKIVAHNKKYFQDGWNVFDFVIVCGTLFGLCLSEIFPRFSSITSVIRLCRIARLFRLIKSVKSLRILFNTLVTSIPSIANIGSLLLLLFFIFSVCGVQLYSMVKLNDDLNEQANFRTFGNAMLLLVRFSTGENWNGFMRSMLASEDDCILEPVNDDNKPWCTFDNEDDDCIELNECGGRVSMYIYFYSFTLIVSFVIFNLFVGVVLEAFDNNEEGEILNPEDLEHFTSKWADFDPEATWHISACDLKKFVKTLDPPLGFGDIQGEENWIDNAAVDNELLDIPINDDGMVNIVQVATHLAKRLAKLKLGDAFHEVLENEDIFSKQKRTLRDIMKRTTILSDKKTKLDTFKSAASLIGKKAVQGKKAHGQVLKLNQVLPLKNLNEPET